MDTADRYDGRRASIGDLARRFDLTWFLQAIVKYRWILSEVLIASFFLQLFAVLTPMFFQVVTDKVLVHRGYSTLDVLVVGLLAVGAFESVLSALRTHIFAHTTSRIDVELGARLFKHLDHFCQSDTFKSGGLATPSRECESWKISEIS